MRIFLVRHGQSKSNIDWALNQKVADHAIELSDEGQRQAEACGEFLQGYLHQKYVKMGQGTAAYMPMIRLWMSPYSRTRQTAAALLRKCVLKDNCSLYNGDGTVHYGGLISRLAGESLFIDAKECLHLHEQQFGIFDGLSDAEREAKYPVEHAYYQKCIAHEGKLWPKMPLGESRADVAFRVHQAFGTFHRDAKKHGINDIVVVAHGTVNRAFIMMWQHLPYEWMDSEPNPANCSIRLLENGVDKGYIFEGFREGNPPTTPEAES